MAADMKVVSESQGFIWKLLFTTRQSYNLINLQEPLNICWYGYATHVGETVWVGLNFKMSSYRYMNVH